MTSASSPISNPVAPVPVQATDRPPVNASAELAKYESQLSDWVHCESSKTSAGKAKIAEISDKIDSIKAQMKKVDDVKPTAPPVAQPGSASKDSGAALRFDQLGAWINLRA